MLKTIDRGFYRNVIRFGLPIAFQSLLSTTASMVDTVMLGALGETTVAGVGICVQFASLLNSCFWGFSAGGMLFYAQYWGEKNEAGICRSYGFSLSCIVAVGLLFGGLAVFAPGFVMGVYTDKESIQQVGIAYLRIVGFSYPLQTLAVAMSGLLRATERVRIPLVASVLSLATNLIANFLLIFGFLGLPRMGARGAAVGTLLAAVVNVAVIAILAWRVRHPFFFKIRMHFAWKRDMFGKYFAKCIPILCNELFIGVGNMVINIVIGRQSEAAIAAMAVFRVLEGFIFAFFSGFSNASAIMVGKAIGAGEHGKALSYAKRLILLCPAFTFAICLGILAVRGWLLSAMGLTGEAFRYGSAMLMIYTVFGTIRTCNWIQNDTFRTGGDPVFGTVMESSFMYLMVLPLVCLTGLYWRLPFLAVFCFVYCDEPIRLIIEMRHMFSGKWIKPVTEKGMAAIEQFRDTMKRRRKAS